MWHYEEIVCFLGIHFVCQFKEIFANYYHKLPNLTRDTGNQISALWKRLSPTWFSHDLL